MTTAQCLDEETILAFTEGLLDAPSVKDLEAHARSCLTCSQLLTAALGAAHGATPARTAASSPAPITRGTAIGRYVVLASVGRGGMGEVFAAYDPELDRKVALKILHADSDSRVTRGHGRLLREAKAIARLSHPNVVVVHDAGTFDDRVFIAMEFIDGETVAAWLAERPRQQREILDVFVAAARGLRAAHDAGLIHRDFKPQNVMVTASGEVRVTDFGLARAVGEDPSTAGADAASESAASEGAPGSPAPARWDVTLTQTGEVLGTPLYMSPEQFLARPTDAQTDQFSYCVALYQALYGAHPFRIDSFAQLMSDVVDGKVQPPPPKSGVPAWLRRVLLRGISPEPAARWPSMAALITALTHDPARARRRTAWALAGVGMLAALGTLTVRELRGTRRPVALCQSGASRIAGAWEAGGAGPRRDRVHTAFLATGVPYAAESWDRVAAQLDDYGARWMGTYRENCEATQVRGEQSAEVLDLRTTCLDERLTRLRALVDVLATADRETVSHAVDASRSLPALDACSDVKLLRTPVEPPANETARRQVEQLRERAAAVDALNLTGKYQRAHDLGHALVRDARALKYRPLLAELLLRSWAYNNSITDYQAAAKELEEAVWLGLATRRDDVAAEAGAMLTGLVGYYMAQHEMGERWATLADAVLDRLGPGHDTGRSWVLQNRAVIRMQANDLDGALDLLRQTLALKRRAFGDDSAEVAVSLSTQADVLFRRGDPAAALVIIKQVKDKVIKAYGASNPSLATALGNEGEYLVALGRYAEAQTAFRDSLARWEPEVGPQHQFLAYPLTGMGVAYWKSGHAADAIAPLERALTIREAHEPDPSTVAETRFALAGALWDAGGDRARARLLAIAALTAYQRPPASDAKAREVTAWLSAHRAR